MSQDNTLFQTPAAVLQQEHLQESYWRLRLRAPEICSAARPGQFVQVAVPSLEAHILRRPFSICDVNGDVLTLVYKTVGAGTGALAQCREGDCLDVLGPLGHGFSPIPAGRATILLGGGYGCAAMLFTAHDTPADALKPAVLLGARSKGDILLADEFAALGCRVEVATNDGSLGRQGFVTVLLEEELKQHPDAFLMACGPRPMLKAVAQIAEKHPACRCEVSLDERMCCGVGACFGCVVKGKDASAPEGWRYLRSCKEGPVFPAEAILW